MTECENAAADGIHPLLVERFSPVAFDRDATLSDDQVDVLLEAARLTPSAGNSQPWMFIVGRRDDPVHSRIVKHLAPSSARWALDAALLVVNLAHILVEDTDWEFSEFARYDLGQAVAHMTIQGLVMGLGAHQFRAFDRDAVAREFDVPAAWEVTSMTALGPTGRPSNEKTQPAPNRARLSRSEITWARE
ncbi:nitroreductase [Mycolicibacterium mucogenicum]|uniref:Nitroreductase n=1 Tax=Mycolicibacterium mucogenicum TaxID=56689 RepID=A0A1A3GIZ9_MYCMU|nr:nitroreductase family protein [Mycolicibacterium mucogenicum]OBJ35785.1 nitroreductase [Mycolicibacterium mucogenicum]